MKKTIEAAYPGATKPLPKGAMTEIRHIVFDVGKVLVHYDPHQAYYDLLPDIAERTAFLTDVCSSAWNQEQDRGRGWEEAEAEAIGRHPDKADLIRAFRQNWHLMVSHEYPDSIAILRRAARARPRRDAAHQFRRRHVSPGAEALSGAGRDARRDGFRRGAADQAGPGDLRASHEIVRPHAVGHAVLRRFAGEHRGGARARMEGRAVHLGGEDCATILRATASAF